MKMQIHLTCVFFTLGMLATGSPAIAGGGLMLSSTPTVKLAGIPEDESESFMPSGPFDGVDRGEKIVWIDDVAYAIDSRLKVVGNSSKLGSLAAIDSGETVDFVTESNPHDPDMPIVVEIHRR